MRCPWRHEARKAGSPAPISRFIPPRSRIVLIRALSQSLEPMSAAVPWAARPGAGPGPPSLPFLLSRWSGLLPRRFSCQPDFPPKAATAGAGFLSRRSQAESESRDVLIGQRARTVLRVRRLLSIPAEPAQGFARRPRRRPFLRGSRVFSPTRPCRGVFGFAQTQQGQDFAGVGGLYYRSQVRRGQGGLTTGGMKRAVEDSSTCGPCGVELMFCRVKINR